MFAFSWNICFGLLHFVQYHTITMVVDCLHNVPNIHYSLATDGEALPHTDTISHIESYLCTISVDYSLRDILFALATSQNKNDDCEK